MKPNESGAEVRCPKCGSGDVQDDAKFCCKCNHVWVRINFRLKEQVRSGACLSCGGSGYQDLIGCSGAKGRCEDCNGTGKTQQQRDSETWNHVLEMVRANGFDSVGAILVSIDQLKREIQSEKGKVAAAVIQLRKYGVDIREVLRFTPEPAPEPASEPPVTELRASQVEDPQLACAEVAEGKEAEFSKHPCFDGLPEKAFTDFNQDEEECALCKQYADEVADLQAQVEQLKRERDVSALAVESADGAMAGCFASIKKARAAYEAKGHSCDWRKACDSLFDKLNDYLSLARDTEINPYGRIMRERDQLRADVLRLEKERDEANNQIAVFNDERNSFIAFTNTLGETRPILVGPIQIAKWHIEKLRADLAAARKKLELRTHQVITCGVIAEGNEHLNSIYQSGGEWDSQQAEKVRALKSQLDQAKQETTKLRGVIDASNQTLGMYEADNAKLREIVRLVRLAQ